MCEQSDHERLAIGATPQCNTVQPRNGSAHNGLVELSKLLLAASYQEVLEIAVSKGKEMSGAEGCCIVIENKKGELVRKAGFPEGHFEPQQTISPECARLLRSVISKGDGILSLLNPCINGNSWFPELIPRHDGFRQLLCMPLFSRGESLGVMMFSFGTNPDHRRFSADSLENLKTVSMLVAAAIGAAYAKWKDEKEMAQREHLSTLGENSACVAHTIRNSLTSIGGFAKRLREKLSGDEVLPEQADRARQYAAIIAEEVAKLESITRSVLTYARFSSQRMNMASCNIHAYLQDLVVRFNARYPGIAFDYTHDRHNVVIVMDMAALDICLDDVVRNAIEARAGTVYIRTKIKPKDKRLLISVVNDGEEICPSLLGMIFDPFMTTKVDGTGLGLANVQAIISAHGGEVKVRSKNTRTEFNIFLPIA